VLVFAFNKIIIFYYPFLDQHCTKIEMLLTIQIEQHNQKKKKMCELTADDVTLITEWFAMSWPVILHMSNSIDKNDGKRVIISETVDIVLLFTSAIDSENITGEDEYLLHIQISRPPTHQWAVTVDEPIVFKKSAVLTGQVQPFLELILRSKYQHVFSVCSCLEFTGKPLCYTCTTTAQVHEDECCICLENEKQRWVTFAVCGHQIHARCHVLLCEHIGEVTKCPLCLQKSDII